MKNESDKISVVSPIYKCEGLVDELITQLKKELSLITDNYEIILVDDASPDQSWSKILNYTDDPKIKAIRLSRNFGQHHAITAGLRFSTGTWTVVMDCDLQDPPNAIRKLYDKANEGFDIVLAKRTQRKDNFFRIIASDINHFLFSYFSGIKTDRSFSNFGIYKKNVISYFNEMNEQARSFSMLIHSLGFNKSFVEIQKDPRFEGESSYSFLKLLNHGINTIVSHSNKPLILSINLGFFISFFSFIMAVYNVIAYFSGIIGVAGFTTTVFSIWFSTGIILTILGVIGLYLGKIYDEVKKRPLFVIQDEINIKN